VSLYTETKVRFGWFGFCHDLLAETSTFISCNQTDSHGPIYWASSMIDTLL
jgi:hypothetical protein